MGFGGLSRQQLAVLVPELLLCGHLIDRAGMPHVLAELGRQGMRDVAIEEWMGASPSYTRRMQRALGYQGDDDVTLIKGLQLDVGAPPQFLDFRFTVEDRWTGTFELAHCGALLDVEPMGEDYVRTMCHEIEDPTMDATAIATNPKARMRPVHRPPRVPADRTPHCRWVVDIDESREAIPSPACTRDIADTEAARFERVSPVDPREEGAGDYAGPLVSDLDFTAFSRSALVRVAEEVCLQWHLLSLAFLRALRRRTTEERVRDLARRQLTGIAGLTAERLHRALGLGDDLEAVATVLALHPVLNPAAYVDLELSRDDVGLVVHLPPGRPAHRDGGWPTLLDADHLEPVDALLRAVDPTWRAVAEPGEGLTFRVVRGAPADEAPEVALVRLSQGAAFELEPRRGLPLTVL